LPGILDHTLRDVVRKLGESRDRGEIAQQEPTGGTESIPLRVTKEIEPGHDVGKLKAEVVVGRSVWLFSMRHLLKNTVSVLQQQKWTILSAPQGIHWITSDDPVIKLNYYRPGVYDFKGGWGNRGTEILLPLSPRHLLYTQVGQRRSRRGEIPRAEAEMIRRFIAEHAHRLIFAAEPDPEVPRLRPRTVNADLWRKWHEEQTAAEREVMGWGQEQAVPKDGE
jgi:hypothetical protein